MKEGEPHEKEKAPGAGAAAVGVVHYMEHYGRGSCIKPSCASNASSAMTSAQKSQRKEVTDMPRLHVTPEENRKRNILGQISEKAYQRFGKPVTGALFGRMFGVKECTAKNRIKSLEDIRLRELRNYVESCNLSDEDILVWFRWRKEEK